MRNKIKKSGKIKKNNYKKHDQDHNYAHFLIDVLSVHVQGAVYIKYSHA